MSLGRQPPPKPRPGARNWPPIRSSWPSASASRITSAPAASHISAIALMNEILVARKALAATLTSSAVSRSIVSTGMPGRERRGVDLAQQVLGRGCEVTPNTMRSGVQAVLHREPLAQELGVPGQVHLVAGRGRGPRSGPAAAGPCRPAPSTCRRSGSRAQVRGERVDRGVHVAAGRRRRRAPAGCRRTGSGRRRTPPTSANEVVKRSRPASRFLRSSGSSPGSKNGASPAGRLAIFSCVDVDGRGPRARGRPCRPRGSGPGSRCRSR